MPQRNLRCMSKGSLSQYSIGDTVVPNDIHFDCINFHKKEQYPDIFGSEEYSCFIKNCFGPHNVNKKAR